MKNYLLFMCATDLTETKNDRFYYLFISNFKKFYKAMAHLVTFSARNHKAEMNDGIWKVCVYHFMMPRKHWEMKPLTDIHFSALVKSF